MVKTTQNWKQQNDGSGCGGGWSVLVYNYREINPWERQQWQQAATAATAVRWPTDVRREGKTDVPSSSSSSSVRWAAYGTEEGEKRSDGFRRRRRRGFWIVAITPVWTLYTSSYFRAGAPIFETHTMPLGTAAVVTIGVGRVWKKRGTTWISLWKGWGDDKGECTNVQRHW